MQLKHGQAVALMVLVTAMWSIAGVVTRQLEAARSFEVTFWRSFFTLISLSLILTLWQGMGVWRRMPWKQTYFWLSGVCWAVMFTAYMVAITLTTVANVLITMSVAPLMTALLTRVTLRQPMPWRTWAAIVVAGAGIAWMYGSQLSLGQDDVLWGCAIALGVPLGGAVQWTLVQKSQTDGHNLDLVPSVLIGALLSCLFSLPLAMPLQASGHDIAWLALLGVVQLAIPCSLSVVCARVLKAPEVSLLSLLEIVFGIALAWVGAHEEPQPAVLLGGSLVLGALVLNEWLAWRNRRV